MIQFLEICFLVLDQVSTKVCGQRLCFCPSDHFISDRDSTWTFLCNKIWPINTGFSESVTVNKSSLIKLLISEFHIFPVWAEANVKVFYWKDLKEVEFSVKISDNIQESTSTVWQ